MRRKLASIFLALIPIGLDLSTGAISPIPSRPKTGAGAFVAGPGSTFPRFAKRWVSRERSRGAVA